MSADDSLERQKPKLVKTSVSIEKDLIDWGQTIPGGLSLMVRVLLRRVKDGELEIKLPTGQVIENPPKRQGQS